MTLRIKDWNATFEFNKTREITGALDYTAWPTRQDSEGFGVLMRTKGGITAYGIFGCLVQIAAKCPARGVLKDERGDWTPERLARKFAMPEKVAADAFAMLAGASIGWLVDVEQVPVSGDKAPRGRRFSDGLAPESRRSGVDPAPKDRTGQEKTGQEQQEQSGGGAAAAEGRWSAEELKTRTAILLRRPEWLPEGKPWITEAVCAELSRLGIFDTDVTAVYAEAKKSRTTLDSPAAYVIAKLRKRGGVG